MPVFIRGICAYAKSTKISLATDLPFRILLKRIQCEIFTFSKQAFNESLEFCNRS